MPVKDDALQSTSSKHPIPQNVMDVEFKVVGDLTLRQFMYLVAGAIIMYIFNKSGLPTFWRWGLMIITLIGTLAVAFIPLQERGLDTWIVNFFKSLFSPSQKVWCKSYYTPEYFLADYAAIIRSEIVTLTPAKSRNRLNEYLGLLPEEMSDMDISEKRQIEQINFMMRNKNGQEKAGISGQRPIVLSQNLKYELTKDEIETKAQILESQIKPKPQPQGLEKKIIDRKMLNVDNRSEIKIPEFSRINYKNNPIVEKEQKQIENVQKIEQIASELTKTIDKALHQFKELSPNIVQKINLNQTVPQSINLNSQTVKNDRPDKPLLKNINSLNINTIPSYYANQKPASIPIAKPAEPLQAPKVNNVENLTTTNKLYAPASAVYETEDFTGGVTERKVSTDQFGLTHEDAVHKEQEGVNTDGNQLAKVLKEEEMAPTKEDFLKTVKSIKTSIIEEVQTVPKNYHSKNLFSQEGPPARKPVTFAPNLTTIAQNSNAINGFNTSSGGKVVSAKSQGYIPNVIYGIVKGLQGEPLAQSIVIIKNEKGDVILTLNTNEHGQFQTLSPLLNGKYTITTIKGNLVFDTFAVNATGVVIRPITVIARK